MAKTSLFSSAKAEPTEPEFSLLSEIIPIYVAKIPILVLWCQTRNKCNMFKPPTQNCLKIYSEFSRIFYPVPFIFLREGSNQNVYLFVNVKGLEQFDHI